MGPHPKNQPLMVVQMSRGGVFRERPKDREINEKDKMTWCRRISSFRHVTVPLNEARLLLDTKAGLFYATGRIFI